MKRLLITLTTMLITFMANGQICPDNSHPHVIDLGLPSGTKWACCNVDTDYPEKQSPNNFGGYYAWGETNTKSVYDWSSYTHFGGSQENCHDIGNNIAGTEYDVSHVHWGGSWVMPSQEQIVELISKCSYTGTTKEGVDGGLFTGPSGDSIFLPAADIRWNGFSECFISGGYYWSSTQSSNSGDAYCLSIDLTWGGGCGGNDRGYGLTVRPVISGTTSIIHPRSSADDAGQAIYNIYGIKVKDTKADINTLSNGIYIRNGKKVVIK